MNVKYFNHISIYLKVFLFLPLFFINKNKFRNFIPLNYRRIIEKLVQYFFFTERNIDIIKSNFILSKENNVISKNLETNGYSYYDFSKCYHSLKLVDCVNKLFIEKKNNEIINNKFNTYNIKYDLF